MIPILGGSWVVICGVISPLIWVITIVTLLMTTHEPPSIHPKAEVVESAIFYPCDRLVGHR